MAIDAKKHTTIATGEKPTRGALAAALLSISDVIPVANTTEQAQVAAAIVATGINLAVNPIVTIRADAPGMHALEFSYDGSTFLPVSGMLHFASKSAADSWATTNGGWLRVADQCTAGGVKYEWNGTSWQASQPWAMAAGSLLITPSAANTPTGVAITFPTGRFSVAPLVQVTPDTSVPGSNVTGTSVNAVSATGATIYLTRTNTTATLLNWQAIQMTPTTANG